MYFFYHPRITEKVFTLDEQESRHCVKVLRMNTGDEVALTNGKGTLFKGKLIDNHIKACKIEIVSAIEYEKKKPCIHMAIAPTKSMDRFEWFLEKVTELGVDEITPVLCEHSERKHIKPERFEKIMISAIKQAQHVYLPTLNPLTGFFEFIQQHTSKNLIIAHCAYKIENHLLNAVKTDETNVILIGPEGDFSKQEVEYALSNQCIEAHLGDSRLRTETAGIVGCEIAHLAGFLDSAQ